MVIAEKVFTEIFTLSQDPDLAEVGGGHGQKGVDFQRFWAMCRIFELKEKLAPDFLILFETVQDIAELDSETLPTTIDIYQIKKKDGGEWSFNSLTGILKPDSRKKIVPITLETIEKSPIGKLYKSGIFFQHLKSNIHFVSNAGCDLPLSTSGFASKHLTCFASDLDDAHTSLLKEGLALLHGASNVVPDLEKLSLRKTTLHPDDPVRLALGTAIEFLVKFAPTHTGQAKALVDALFMQLSTLGRQTEPVKSFAEIRHQRGFSSKDMDDALSALQAMPDLRMHLANALQALKHEGLGTLRMIAIDIGISKYFSNAVAGTVSAEELVLINDCINVAQKTNFSDPMAPILNREVINLTKSHPDFKDTEIFAYLLIQVIKNATT